MIKLGLEACSKNRRRKAMFSFKEKVDILKLYEISNSKNWTRKSVRFLKT